MKVLIIGKTSNLAKHLIENFHLKKRIEILGLSSNKDFDYVKDINKLEKIINKFKPKFIFNLAAISKHNNCYNNPKLAYEINAFFPYKLMLMSKKYKIYLIHFSTEAVFCGTQNKLHEVSDIPIPNTILGKSKLCGEKLILNSSYSLIVRLPMLYGKYFKNGYVYESMQSIMKKKNKYLANNIYCSPVNASDVANYLLENIFNKNGIRYLLNKKIIHLSNNIRTTRYGFIKKINKSNYIKKNNYVNINSEFIIDKFMGLRSNINNFKSTNSKYFFNEIEL